nr:AI-2E family transporter [Tessaracoccus coleopterorum]
MLGALAGLAIGGAVASLSSILVTVLIALFFALALDPLVRRLEARGVARGVGIGITFAGVVVVVGAMLAFVVPATVTQVVGFTKSVPGFIAALEQQPWFQEVTGLGGEEVYSALLERLQAWVSNPANLLALGNGVLAFGSGLINGISGTMIGLVLTLYFLASLDAMKQAMYRLLPAYKRSKAAEVTEQITRSVGGAIGGAIQLGILNAIFSFLLLTVLGIPYAMMLAFLALLVSMLPMIGSVMVWIIASLVCLTDSWQTALIFALVYFVYMQIEAYVLTPAS